MNVSPLSPSWRATVARHGLPLALIAILLYLMLRNTGAYPVVFADEWLYSKSARLQPLSESQLPSYLYLWLFGMSNACGEGFLQCARVLNAVLFVASAPFIYLVARPLTGTRAAAVIAALAMLSPVSSYTAYFMPEAMYYFGFWVATYLLLRPGALRAPMSATLGYGLLAGVLLGLLALIKVHALFLLPPLCVHIVCARRAAGAGAAGTSDRWLVAGAAAALLAVATTFAVKAALAYALAGPVGLSLFGSFYGGHVNNSGHGLGRLLAPFAHNLLGHSMALILLFAFPLLMLASAAASGAVRQAIGPQGRALLLWTLLMLGGALGMTVAYTASIADAGPNEIIRLHLRYYDFTFPLLMIAGVAVAAAGGRAGLRLRAVLAGPAALLLVLSTAALLPAFLTSPIDSPELFSMTTYRPLFLGIVALELVVIALWVAQPARAGMVYLAALLPLVSLSGEMFNSYRLQRLHAPSAYDKAGRFAHDYLDADQRAKLSIAGADLAGMMRAQFHVDHAQTAIIELQPNAPVEASQMPARQRWLLVVGPHRLPTEWQPVLATTDYALMRPSNGGRSLVQIPMTRPMSAGALEGVDGLADPEDWGSWSNSDTVVLRFKQALPRNLTVLLNGRAFGPNVGLPFVLSVGEASTSFKLPATPQELSLRLQTDGAQHELRIGVPRPTTPKEIGAGNDLRRLGVGLISLEIGEALSAPRAPAAAAPAAQ